MQIKHNLFKLILTMAAAVLLAGCTEKLDGASHAVAPGNLVYSSTAAAPKMMAAKATAAANDVIESAEEVPSEQLKAEQKQIAERKLIRNGYIDLEVEDLNNASEAAEKLAAEMGGYVSSSEIYENYSHYTIRIPAANFDLAMTKTGEMGIIRSRNVSAQDVTDQFYDLQGRIETKKIMRANLERYLKEAKNLTDTLQIEKELNDVISELESMEGRMKRLANQIDFSTLNITFELPKGQLVEEIHKPGFKERLKDFGGGILKFFQILLMIIAVLIICGIPLVAVAALFYWLLFGKVGLIRRLFKKLK